jgi:hypothetical protein
MLPPEHGESRQWAPHSAARGRLHDGISPAYAGPVAPGDALGSFTKGARWRPPREESSAAHAPAPRLWTQRDRPEPRARPSAQPHQTGRSPYDISAFARKGGRANLSPLRFLEFVRGKPLASHFTVRLWVRSTSGWAGCHDARAVARHGRGGICAAPGRGSIRHPRHTAAAHHAAQGGKDQGRAGGDRERD